MKSRIVSLFLGVAFMAAPVLAQVRPPSNSGPGGGGAIQQLASDLGALTARVAKLEGDIVASDLAGTYSFTVLNTAMHGVRATPPVADAAITTSAIRATLTLNADRTGQTSAPNSSIPACEGSTLTLPSGTMHEFNPCEESNQDVTWTYVDGVITIRFSDGDEIPLNVAVGGRFLLTAFAPFHPGDPSSDQALMIAIRLK